MQELKNRIKQLMEENVAQRALGWKKGEFGYDAQVAFFESTDELDDFVYNGFCGANLSKYMIEACKKEGRTIICLKPCDTYSFNQLLKEHRIQREKAYIIGVGCKGTLDISKIKANGIEGIVDIEGADMFSSENLLKIKTVYGDHELAYSDALLERCNCCKGKEHMIFDEIIGQSADTVSADRFEQIRKIEQMTSIEKFEFFKNELSKCIRCNACRNACPACNCRKCVFDSDKFDSAQKANSDSFEEKMFHIIRAFHVAGRCTDCGECSRVCPQNIPLHLFNRKFIKDINMLYGDFSAGSNCEENCPLTSYSFDDAEPGKI